MEQILFAYDLPKETVTAIMMLYKNRKVKFHSPDRDTDYFDIFACVLQEVTATLHLLIIYLYYVLWTSTNLMKENNFKLTKERNRRYPAKTITDVDFSDDITLLANSSAQAESMLYSLERVAGGIGLFVNVVKTEYMCFNYRGKISTLNGGPLKLVNKFTYLGSSVSSTKNDINS